jgi:hypothetical protein
MSVVTAGWNRFIVVLVVVSTGLIYIARVYTSVVHRKQPVAG